LKRLKTLEVVGGNRRDGETQSFGESWDLLHAKSANRCAKSGVGAGGVGDGGMLGPFIGLVGHGDEHTERDGRI